MIKIRAVIEHITFQNSENGYSIMKAKVKDQTDLVTLVGIMLDVPVGSVLMCEGDWKVDRRYGQQFVVESFEEVMPATFDTTSFILDPLFHCPKWEQIIQLEPTCSVQEKR